MISQQQVLHQMPLHEGVVTVFDAGPNLTMENAHEVMGLIRLLPSAVAPRVIVNMSHTTAIDSTGVGALVSTMRHVRHLGGWLCVANLTPELVRVFQTMNLHTVVDIFDTMELAFQHVNSLNIPSKPDTHD